MIVKHFLSRFRKQNRVQVELPDSVMRLTISEAIELRGKLDRILAGFLPEVSPAVTSENDKTAERR